MITGRRRLDQRGNENLLMRDQLEGMQANPELRRERDADAKHDRVAIRRATKTRQRNRLREIFHEFDRDSLNAQARSVNGVNNPEHFAVIIASQPPLIPSANLTQP